MLPGESLVLQRLLRRDARMRIRQAVSAATVIAFLLAALATAIVGDWLLFVPSLGCGFFGVLEFRTHSRQNALEPQPPHRAR